jgi:CheY-like chemotaxis protein
MKKILVVDPLASSLARQRALLERADVEVFGSADAAAALEIHRRERVDLIIVDLDLPGAGAEELCGRIRGDAELKTVSVIVVCRNREADLQRASACRANACLTRPVRGPQLRQAAERLFDVPDRRSYRVLVRVETEDASAKRAFFCTSKNLSAAGLLIETDTPLASGDVITCSFFLPERARIVARAEVVRVGGPSNGSFQYGVRFRELGPGDRAAIRSFVEARPGRGRHGA